MHTCSRWHVYTWKVEYITKWDTRGMHTLSNGCWHFKPLVVEGPRIRRPNFLLTSYLFTYSTYAIWFSPNFGSYSVKISDAIQTTIWWKSGWIQGDFRWNLNGLQGVLRWLSGGFLGGSRGFPMKFWMAFRAVQLVLAVCTVKKGYFNLVTIVAAQCLPGPYGNRRMCTQLQPTLILSVSYILLATWNQEIWL